MSNKQSSVEWLIEQIIMKHPIITQYLPNYNFDKEIVEQAKAMEKQQIIDAVDRANKKWRSQQAEFILDGNQYYNETFGGNNGQQ